MMKRITNNLAIKFFCVFLALILWAYVAAGQSTVGKFPGKIKIKAINIPSGLEAVYDIKTVDIKIMADSATWKKLSADSFTAQVDLGAQTEGTYEVPVVVNSNVSGVTVVEKDPEKIFVRLEPIISKEILVSAKVEGSAGEGLMAGDVEIVPDKVLARGPKSTMENIQDAWIQIRLNGETEDFSKNSSVYAVDDNGEEATGIEFTPSEVKANIAITKASNNKTVGVRVVTQGQPKTGYFVSQISATPLVVDIIGPKSVIESINYINTAPFDLTNLSSDTERELSLDLKNGIVLQSGFINVVKVKVKLSKSETTRELTAGITVKNLNGYSVSGFSSNEVRVIITGSSDVVENLKNSDVSLVLDFSSKTLQDTVNFNVISSDFKVPQGITVIGFLPSSINAFLRRN